LVASFPQNAIAGIEAGLEAELAFQAYPGRIFQAKVLRVQDIIREGQVDVENLKLPAGAHVSIAVYTHHFHVLSLVRKIILRIKSWENYAFFMKNFDSLH